MKSLIGGGGPPARRYADYAAQDAEYQAQLAEHEQLQAARRSSLPQHRRQAPGGGGAAMPDAYGNMNIADLERELAELRARTGHLDPASNQAAKPAGGGYPTPGVASYGPPPAAASGPGGSATSGAFPYADAPHLENLSFENANPNVGSHGSAPPAPAAHSGGLPVREYSSKMRNASGGDGRGMRDAIYGGGGGSSNGGSHSSPQKMAQASGGHGRSAARAIYGGGDVPMPAGAAARGSPEQVVKSERASGGHGRGAKSAIYGGYVPSLVEESAIPRRKQLAPRAPCSGGYGYGVSEAATTQAARAYDTGLAASRAEQGMPSWWG